MRQVLALAAKSRGDDTEIAHVTPGEIVLPKAFQTTAVLGAIRQAAAEANIPLDRLRIGSPANSINPETGMPEFGVMDWASRLFERQSPIPDLSSMREGLADYDFGLPGVDENGMTPEMRAQAARSTNAPINIGRTARPVGALENSMHGFMQGFMSTPLSVGEAIVNTGASIYDGGKPVQQRFYEQQKQIEDNYQAERAAAGRSGFNVPRAAGELLSGYPVGKMIPKFATYGGATALGAAQGALQNALQPVDDPSGPYWQQKAEQIKKGAIQGAIQGRAEYLGKQAKDWFGF